MKSSLVTASMMAAFLCSGAIAENREADAHRHGHGILHVALDGKVLSIELETPGADILGFEHQVESADDEKTVETARKVLTDPLILFGVPKGAGCSVMDAEIEIGAEGDEHDDDHADKHDDDHGDEHDHADKHDDHAEEEGHSEVHAHYTISCTDPSAINGLDLTGFFAAFPNSEELDAAILTEAGQAGGELTPSDPVLAF